MIRLLLCVFVCCVIGITYALPTGGGKKADIRKTTTVKTVRNGQASSRLPNQEAFPEELEFDFFVEGEEPVKSMSRKIPEMRSMPVFDSAGKEHKRDRKDEQFYVSDKGSFQLSMVNSADGSKKTDLKATYRNGHGEKCFYARGMSHCWRIDGEGTFETMSMEGDTIDEVTPNSTESRQRRQLVYTDFNPTRIYRVAYVVDKSFMDWFRVISGDDATAIEDAEDYIYMVNNEVNLMYRGIKEVSEASSSIQDMDITVYAQGFYYPTLGTEWSWLRRYVNSNGVLINVLPVFGNWVAEGNIGNIGSLDTATLITQSPLVQSNGGGVLGIAYLATVCNPNTLNRRVSLNEDRFFDVTLTLVHEMGHSIGSFHDDEGGCQAGTFIMSPYAFDITSDTQDTWNRWSTCSVGEITDHVRSFPGCLLGSGISNDDFYDQLCRGVRGSNQFDVDYQCKSASKIQTSVACAPTSTATNKKVPARACWDNGVILCTDTAGICSNTVFTIYDGTPCIGSNPSTDYVCFRGDCLQKVDVCAGRSTQVPGSTQSTATSPTTTAAPTPPPPTPCSCSGIFVFFRFGCCNSNRGSDNSCCVGCRPNGSGCTVSFFG